MKLLLYNLFNFAFPAKIEIASGLSVTPTRRSDDQFFLTQIVAAETVWQKTWASFRVCDLLTFLADALNSDAGALQKEIDGVLFEMIADRHGLLLKTTHGWSIARMQANRMTIAGARSRFARIRHDRAPAARKRHTPVG